jgi:hypothetical protein
MSSGSISGSGMSSIVDSGASSFFMGRSWSNLEKQYGQAWYFCAGVVERTCMVIGSLISLWHFGFGQVRTNVSFDNLIAL